jgi:CHASE3 domain sensor protein
MSFYARVRLALAVGMILMAGCVWLLAAQQREVMLSAQAQSTRTSALLTAMLEQETGPRGYVQTGLDEFLTPYRRGRAEYARVQAKVAGAATDPAQRRLIDDQQVTARTWGQAAETAIADTRRQGRRLVEPTRPASATR